jgi:serine O-acetyltransferase
MINVAILGCLATRNCRNYFDSKFVKEILYAPKMSLIAVSGDPIKYSESALEKNLDPFQRGIVSRDLNKTFWNEVERGRPDFLLIDFAEEVYDLVAGHEEKSFVTNSDYFSRVKASLLDEEFHLIKRESNRFEELWIHACQHFSGKTASLKIKPVIVRMYVPEHFVSMGNICSYDDVFLDKIKRINIRLDRCYSVFSQYVDCHEIEVPPDSQISQFSDGKKIGIADYTKDLSELIAAKVASTCELESYLIPSSTEKVDIYLSEFAPLLDVGDIPSVYELYVRGRELRLSGDENGAIRCERLISLLRNCSVPLSADLGKVTFGYGGIAVIIHANVKIGDYVTIGSNVTVGGGSTRLDQHGVTRAVPIIGNRVYIATGAKILGGIEIGSHCVIGANAVVTKDIQDFSVVAGVPGKVVAHITPDNLHKYSGYLYKGLALQDARKIMFNC